MIRDVTLSFDNGPTAGVTEHVLDVLRQHDILSSFFVLGGKLAEPPLRALASRARDEGHWIGNHTYTHSVPLGKVTDANTPDLEIGRTQTLIGNLSHPARLFRPSGGGGALGRHLLSPEAADYLQRGQYTCVLWNAVPHDWDDPQGWVETALVQCRALPWAVVVLHDLPTGAMAYLPSFIDRARAEGARFRQEFPRECLAMVEGNPAPSLETFVAEGTRPIH